MAISSHGTFLKVGDGATPEVFVTIAQVKDIDGPGMTLNTEDTTNHDSNGWREMIPTILEAGEVSFDVNYIADTSQTVLQEAQVARTRLNFQMAYPAPVPADQFSGYVTSVSKAAPVEGILTASVTITIDGPVTEVVTP